MPSTVDSQAEYFSKVITRVFDEGSGVGDVRVAAEAGRPPGLAGGRFVLLDAPKFSLCLEGEARYHVRCGNGMAELTAQPGAVVFAPPQCGMEPVPGASYRAMGIAIHPGFTRFLLAESKRRAGPRGHRIMRSHHCEHALGEDGLLLGELVARAKDARVRRRVMEVILLLAGEVLEKPARSRRGGKGGFMLEAACQYVREHLARPISRMEVARHLHMHPNHLSRVFTRKGEGGFSQYVQAQRLERAKTLLASPGMNVTEVALICGFGSVSYFSRSYRRRFGRSPGGG